MVGGGDTRIALIVACKLGNITDLSSHIWYNLSLVGLCAGQLTSKCSRVPGVSVQLSAIQKPLLFLDAYASLGPGLSLCE